MYFSPTIGNKHDGHNEGNSSLQKGNNVNVNVNLSINEGFFSPHILSNNSSFSKMSKFPMKTTPTHLYNPPNMKNPRSATHLPPSRLNNPESSFNLVK